MEDSSENSLVNSLQEQLKIERQKNVELLAKIEDSEQQTAHLKAKIEELSMEKQLLQNYMTHSQTKITQLQECLEKAGGEISRLKSELSSK
ncbi:unnamed protein product [Blepharisma stoltei]|uniref:Uncharacterized protein n=1 Tax=Blepharisma stoltei TaxID=1481888 RepID=A0AAU9IBE1_9CILI|nr:unnamed protein product [Blepharisma stoltei]